MKLISLNIWDAKIYDPLMNFFEMNQDVDIFCLQEVWNGTEAVFFRDGKRMNGFSEIAIRLPQHVGFFCSTEELDDIPSKGLAIPYGTAIFINKNIPIVSHHHDFIFDPGNFANENARTHKRVIQTVCISHQGKPLAISTVHGLWNGQGKTDTPERVGQSQKIKAHIDSFKHGVILAGDFNLLPDTQSLAIVALGMKDMIKEYGITSTRSNLYVRGSAKVLFADYIFTSPEITIKNFEVLKDEVSDHSPLLVEFV